MKTSENIDEICKALAAFHSEVGRITKDGTNPYLKNRYATIDQIIEEIRPILASKGLFILQAPSNTENGEIQMTTRILHESGQWIESPALTLKAQKNDPQAIGSAVTYARRYSLTSFLSLNTGEDDDGHQASAPRETPKKTQKQPKQPKADNTPMTDEDAMKITTLVLDITGDDNSKKNRLETWLRNKVPGFESLDDNMTKKTATMVIGYLQGYKSKKQEAAGQ